MEDKPFYNKHHRLLHQLSKWRMRKGAWQDMMHLDEFAVRSGGYVDLATIDLKTWTVRGYEVKMSRADFLRDEKWTSYLPNFHFFWFAIPEPGIILPEELPDGIGLLTLNYKKNEDRYSGEEIEVEGLKELKRATRLQPLWVRRSFGEEFTVKLLAGMLRSNSWRRSRVYQDGMRAGANIVIQHLIAEKIINRDQLDVCRALVERGVNNPRVDWNEIGDKEGPREEDAIRE